MFKAVLKLIIINTAFLTFWFINFYLNIDGSDGETLNDVLQFWTCWPSLPMLEEKLSVSFLPKTDKLAEVDTCWKSLKIPVIFSTYEEFKENLDISVKCGKSGFGKF